MVYNSSTSLSKIKFRSLPLQGRRKSKKVILPRPKLDSINLAVDSRDNPFVSSVSRYGPVFSPTSNSNSQPGLSMSNPNSGSISSPDALGRSNSRKEVVMKVGSTSITPMAEAFKPSSGTFSRDTSFAQEASPRTQDPNRHHDGWSGSPNSGLPWQARSSSRVSEGSNLKPAVQEWSVGNLKPELVYGWDPVPIPLERIKSQPYPNRLVPSFGCHGPHPRAHRPKLTDPRSSTLMTSLTFKIGMSAEEAMEIRFGKAYMEWYKQEMAACPKKITPMIPYSWKVTAPARHTIRPPPGLGFTENDPRKLNAWD